MHSVARQKSWRRYCACLTAIVDTVCAACSECAGSSVETQPCLARHDRRCTRQYHVSIICNVTVDFSVTSLCASYI